MPCLATADANRASASRGMRSGDRDALLDIKGKGAGRAGLSTVRRQSFAERIPVYWSHCGAYMRNPYIVKTSWRSGPTTHMIRRGAGGESLVFTSPSQDQNRARGRDGQA